MKSLRQHFDLLILNGSVPIEALRSLTKMLKSGAYEVAPPLPSTWHLEMDPQGEVFLVKPDGELLDARQIFLREPYVNPFEPVPLSPSAQAALDAMTFDASAAEKAASSELAAELIPEKAAATPPPSELRTKPTPEPERRSKDEIDAAVRTVIERSKQVGVRAALRELHDGLGYSYDGLSKVYYKRRDRVGAEMKHSRKVSVRKKR